VWDFLRVVCVREERVDDGDMGGEQYDFATVDCLKERAWGIYFLVKNASIVCTESGTMFLRVCVLFVAPSTP
jgi:hypothetical protein